MSKVLQRGTAMLAVMIASLVFVTTALAQMPTSPWKKGAPFPEPDEELYGVAANGKLYVIGGWDDGKAGGVNYEYDPATDKWTKKTADAAAGAPCGSGRCERQDLRDGRLRPAEGHRHPARRRMGAHRQRVGVRPGGGFLEVAAAAAQQARVRGGRRSRRQDLRDRRRDDDGRASHSMTRAAVSNQRTRSSRPSDRLGFSASTKCTTPPRTSGRPASRCRCRAITRSAAPSTARSTSSAAAPATASSCPPRTRMWSRSTTPSPTRGVLRRSGCPPLAAEASSGTDGRRIYVAGGEVTTKELVGAFRASRRTTR